LYLILIAFITANRNYGHSEQLHTKNVHGNCYVLPYGLHISNLVTLGKIGKIGFRTMKL